MAFPRAVEATAEGSPTPTPSADLGLPTFDNDNPRERLRSANRQGYRLPFPQMQDRFAAMSPVVQEAFHNFNRLSLIDCFAKCDEIINVVLRTTKVSRPQIAFVDDSAKDQEQEDSVSTEVDALFDNLASLALAEQRALKADPRTPTRPLAYVRRVDKLEMIRSSRGMELASIDGWKGAVRRGDWKVGELCLYIEIDAFVPASDSILGASCGLLDQPTRWKGRRGYHVRTRPFGTQISQGLILDPFQVAETDERYAELLELLGHDAESAEAELMAEDFTRDLGITKWAAFDDGPGGAAARDLGKRPAFVPSTDVERVQKSANLFTAKYARDEWQETIKMDGAAMTVYFVHRGAQLHRSLAALPASPAPALAARPAGRLGVCSRHRELWEHDGSAYWAAARASGLADKLAADGRSVAVQGELVGWGINGNRHGYGEGEREFFIFNIVDLDGGRREPLHPRETARRAVRLGVRHVPVLGYVRMRDIARSHEDLMWRAEGRDGEGLVFRNCRTKNSLKAISNKYLLKIGE